MRFGGAVGFPGRWSGIPCVKHKLKELLASTQGQTHRKIVYLPGEDVNKNKTAKQGGFCECPRNGRGNESENSHDFFSV